MPKESVAVSITLPFNLLKDVMTIAQDRRMNRSETIAWLVQQGIERRNRLALLATEK